MRRKAGFDQLGEWPIRVAALRSFDIETTGLRPDRGAEITEMALVDRTSIRYHWTRAFSSVYLESFPAQLTTLLEHLSEGIVVGHNLPFDFKFLAYEAERFGLEGPRVRFIDTMVLARRILGNAQDIQLGALVDHFGCATDDALHTALGDARATLEVFWALVERGDITTLAEAGVRHVHWSTF